MIISTEPGSRVGGREGLANVHSQGEGTQVARTPGSASLSYHWMSASPRARDVRLGGQGDLPAPRGQSPPCPSHCGPVDTRVSRPLASERVWGGVSDGAG